MTAATLLNVLAAAALVLGSLAACSEESAQPEGGESPQAMPSAGQGEMQQLRAACPMVVEGTEVTASDTDEGVALELTTDEGDAGDLRARVEHMAAMYEMHRGAHGSMMWRHMGGEETRHGGPGTGMGHMRGRGPMPGANAAVTDIEGGARLELTPTDPAQLKSLREHARWHAQRMQSGECWMWQEQGESGEESGQ